MSNLDSNNNHDHSDKLYADLKPEQFIRGETPHNIEEQCLSLCRDYIGGSWNCVYDKSDFTVSRITGGLSNQLYRVKLGDFVLKNANLIYPEDPTDVTIKLYEKKLLISHHEDDPERLNDTIVLTVMSQTELGPKVYGIFEGGFIQAYHQHRKVGKELQNDPTILRQISLTLARVHHLNVPIRKTPNWQLKQTKRMISTAFELHPVDELCENLGLTTLTSFDIHEEFQELQDVVSSLKYPLVFCHNDFLGSNILVTEPGDRIVLVDYDYCSYGCRGYDLGVFLTQWGLEPNNYPDLDIPEDEVIERFIRLYIDGCESIEPGYSEKPENSPRIIMYETKLFTMVFFLFWTSFALHQKEAVIYGVEFDLEANFKFAENYFTKFQKIKKDLQTQDLDCFNAF